MLIFSFFLYGLIIGSFLNVVALRFESGETLGGRSHCPRCQALIRWYDNVPLFSFLFLRGRCRTCHAGISWQYPLVELGTGLLFAAIGAWYVLPSPWELSTVGFAIGYLVLASLAIVILVSDFRTLSIPIVFLGALASIAALLALGHAVFPQAGPEGALLPSWMSRVGGGAAATLLFGALVYFSRETWMGMGDVWIAATLGLMVGIESLLLSLTLAFFLGAASGLILMWRGQKGMRSQIAFAPFLVIGLFLMLFLQWTNPSWLGLVVLPLGEVVQLFLG